MVGGWPPAPTLRQDSDWVIKTVRVPIPPGAMYVKLLPALYSCDGNFRYRRRTNRRGTALEALPLTTGFPEGTFERFDDTGRPQGWRYSDPKLCAAVADGSKPFPAGLERHAG